MVAFQPDGDLRPCTWYQVEVTRDLVDAQQRSVNPFRSRFRTSGCQFATGPQRVTGTVECTARGGFAFTPGLKAAASPAAVTGGALMQLQGCAGGQDGRIPQGASLPVAGGIAVLARHARKRFVS